MSTATVFDSTATVELPEPTCATTPAASVAPRKPRLWTAFATYVAATVTGQVAVSATVIGLGIVIGVIMGFQGADPATIQGRVLGILQQPLVMMLIMLLPCQLGMAAVLWFAVRRSKASFRERLGLVPQTGRPIGTVKLAMLAGFTVSVAWATLLLLTIYCGMSASGGPISNAVAGGSLGAITFVSLVLCIVPVVVEECLFRGYLQRRFLERWSPAVAITVSTLMFAIVHFDSLPHIVSVIALGAVTGLVAYRTNSVKPGMVVHALHNVVVVGFSAIAPTLGATIGLERLGQLFIGMIVVLGLIGLPAVISLLRRSKAVTTAELPAVRHIELTLPQFAFDSHLASSVA